MSETLIKSIKELKETIDAGYLDESKLNIMIDNDGTYYSYGTDEHGDPGDLEMNNGDGQMDVYELYEVLFPKANVSKV